MILELADIRIHPGRHAEFEAAIRRGVETVIAHAKGFRGYRVDRGVESPDRYLLLIEWDSLEDHTEGFRGSSDFARWRELVGPFFAAPPVVEHFSAVAGPPLARLERRAQP